MAQEQVADDFDWVGAQAKCSAALMFERLQTHVEEDVRRRNGLLGRPDGWKFEFYAEDDADVFEVLTLEGSLKARDHFGGTAPNQVYAACKRARARLKE